jgi:hypothetical protein
MSNTSTPTIAAAIVTTFKKVTNYPYPSSSKRSSSIPK